MRKLLFVAIAAMCFSCASKKQDEKKETVNEVKKVEAVHEHQCTGDCDSHTKTGHTHAEKDHECSGDCGSHAEKGDSEVKTTEVAHHCDGDCKNCPTENCKARKVAYQGNAAKTEKGTEVKKDHECSGHCGSCEH